VLERTSVGLHFFTHKRPSELMNLYVADTAQLVVMQTPSKMCSPVWHVILHLE